MRQKHGPARDFASPESWELARSRCLVGRGIGEPVARQREGFARIELRGRRSTFADIVAGAAFSQGEVQISWQGQHFPKVKYRFRGRGCIFAR